MSVLKKFNSINHNIYKKLQTHMCVLNFFVPLYKKKMEKLVLQYTVGKVVIQNF